MTDIEYIESKPDLYIPDYDKPHLIIATEPRGKLLPTNVYTPPIADPRRRNRYPFIYYLRYEITVNCNLLTGLSRAQGQTAQIKIVYNSGIISHL